MIAMDARGVTPVINQCSIASKEGFDEVLNANLIRSGNAHLQQDTLVRIICGDTIDQTILNAMEECNAVIDSSTQIQLMEKMLPGSLSDMTEESSGIFQEKLQILLSEPVIKSIFIKFFETSECKDQVKLALAALDASIEADQVLRRNIVRASIKAGQAELVCDDISKGLCCLATSVGFITGGIMTMSTFPMGGSVSMIAFGSIAGGCSYLSFSSAAESECWKNPAVATTSDNYIGVETMSMDREIIAPAATDFDTVTVNL
jgi:hypothetical protein